MMHNKLVFLLKWPCMKENVLGIVDLIFCKILGHISESFDII